MLFVPPQNVLANSHVRAPGTLVERKIGRKWHPQGQLPAYLGRLLLQRLNGRCSPRQGLVRSLCNATTKHPFPLLAAVCAALYSLPPSFHGHCGAAFASRVSSACRAAALAAPTP